MSEERGEVPLVFFILTKDPTQLQGNTEKHYLARHLADRTDLSVFAPLSEEIPGARNRPLPVKGLKGAVWLNLFLLPYWLYVFATERPDIVFCYQNVIIPAVLGKLSGATVAFDLRSDPFEQAQEFFEDDDRGLPFRLAMQTAKRLHEWVLKYADRVFVVSDPLKDTICLNYAISQDAVTVLPLGVDTDHFVPSDDGWECLSILYVGSLAEYRGIDTIIEAALRLPKSLQCRTRIDLYGDGDEEYLSLLITKADNTPLEVYWHGFVAHDQLPAEAARSDIAVSPIPPYQSYEVSSPAKIFEYQALGLPIVASRITPHERILGNGDSGLLYSPESTAEFAQALERLLTDDELREQMGEDARKASMDADWDRQFETVLFDLGVGHNPQTAASQ